MRSPRIRRFLAIVGANALMFLLLLVPVELIFGTWLRSMGMSDIRRFSVPVGARMQFDATRLYDGGPGIINYTRDDSGLRGTYPTLSAIDVVTIGGSTTDQRYLDDAATWQAVTQRELERLGDRRVIVNAGVDGQSSVGHLFNFDFWFPLLPELRPRVFLFYVGVNDVMRNDRRGEFDGALDARSWRVQSATYQLIRTVRSNFRARSVGVTHGRKRAFDETEFTTTGLVSAEQREAIATRVGASFLRNIDSLRQRVVAMGAKPIFVTQTAYAWTGDRAAPARGLKDVVTVDGVTVNFSDVSYVHQQMNRGLLRVCQEHDLLCFDLAHDVSFEPADFYDFVHNSPSGAEKIGRYVATRLHDAVPASAVR